MTTTKTVRHASVGLWPDGAPRLVAGTCETESQVEATVVDEVINAVVERRTLPAGTALAGDLDQLDSGKIRTDAWIDGSWRTVYLPAGTTFRWRRDETAAKNPNLTVYRHSHTPDVDHDEGGILHGSTEPGDDDGPHWETPRALALYAEMDRVIRGDDADSEYSAADDEELSIVELPDGRWALVGLSVEGSTFVVENRPPGGVTMRPTETAKPE